MKKRLVKSKKNKVVSGVLGGIAEYFNLDTTIVRIVFIALMVVSFGTALFFYLLLSLVMPDSMESIDKYGHDNRYYHSNSEYTKNNRKPAEKVEDEDWSDF